ncbi:MAG: GNAT family N-acetyltransferase [Flavobacteriaceae bacterium]
MIKGKLTGLRAVEKEDLPLLRDWRNITHFRRNFREVRELSMYHQEKWITAVNNRSTDYMFVIVDLASNQAIGAAGLLYINWIIRSADFSFYIGANEQYIDDKGLADDAARLLINYGFNTLNLNKIWMELYEFDDKKLRFFREDFHFVTDGKLRQNCYEDGRYWDAYLISLLRKEWTLNNQ